MAFAICAVAIAFYRDPSPDERAWGPGMASGGDGSLGAGGPLTMSEPEQGLPAVTGDEATDRAALKPGFLTVIRSRDILLMGLAAMFLCIVEFSALAHLVLFLHASWAYTAVAAGGLLALCQAAGAFGKPLSGLISD